MILLAATTACGGGDAIPGATVPIDAVDAAPIDAAAVAPDLDVAAEVPDARDDDVHTPPPDAADARIAMCQLTAPTSCPEPAVRYADIAPIVERRCLSCHNGRGSHWPLTSYEHVADWQDTIRAAMLDCSMPPAEARSDMSLEERLTLLHWVRCGALP